jgi:hypothetical protein
MLAATAIAPTDETAEAAQIVEKFLVASMVPDPETAAQYIAEPLKLTFTGGRKYTHPRESAAFNAKRYKWVKKKMERTDVAPGAGETAMSIALSSGAARSCRWMSGTTVPSVC